MFKTTSPDSVQQIWVSVPVLSGSSYAQLGRVLTETVVQHRPPNELVPQIRPYPNSCQYPLINYLAAENIIWHLRSKLMV